MYVSILYDLTTNRSWVSIWIISIIQSTSCKEQSMTWIHVNERQSNWRQFQSWRHWSYYSWWRWIHCRKSTSEWKMRLRQISLKIPRWFSFVMDLQDVMNRLQRVYKLTSKSCMCWLSGALFIEYIRIPTFGLEIDLKKAIHFLRFICKLHESAEDFWPVFSLPVF